MVACTGRASMCRASSSWSAIWSARDSWQPVAVVCRRNSWRHVCWKDEPNMKSNEMQEDTAQQEDPPVLDLASRLTQDHHQSLKLWLRMLSCTTKIENEIRSRLRATFGITLPRFDLMAQLERYPQGLRMGEIGRAH